MYNMDLLHLKLRSAIADKEWYIACANHDVARFDNWLCDYSQGIALAQSEIDSLLKQIEEVTKSWEHVRNKKYERGSSRTVEN